MLPASVLPVNPGDRVLDLCAAPGGKSTHLAAKLGGKGLLVANDASASRAKALLKNLTVWGCTNSVITGETPEKLLEAFEENNISFEHMPSGIDTVSVILPKEEYEQKEEAIMESLKRLLEPDKIEVDRDMALVTVVGKGMRSVSGIAATFFSSLGAANVNIKMIDMGSNEVNCTIGVKNEDFEKAIQALYYALVEPERA